MDLDLTGRHALVCGASEGIGRAAAHELAALGADVTVLARRAQALEEVVAALPRRDAQRHRALAADLLDRESLRDTLDALVAKAPVHILVNNSGGPPGGPVFAADEAAFVAAFGQHLLAGHALVQAVVPGMRAAGWGRIVNVVSTSVYEPIAGLGVSNTVRGAVAGWAKTLSRELGPHGITVNNVLPGYTETARIEQILRDRTAASGRSREELVATMLASVPVGRFARAEEPAGVIAFLCSPAAAYVNGVSLAVDGGRMQSI
ncbi:SDR family oxidoreductase [Luteimonas sp. M1R5S18]|uniref:SDR family oxidoreductase n=1 Tax=Luteimonas rhizosphaericola TaxID=3042024 RepID=A0ABT6JH70_9GAMM|nr:SDR family oxidoreductase [Luteimonas rhizosphaericola]MDH5829887.1 SDR family oxidoreductase [Luteimonas rhizosphaericola]